MSSIDYDSLARVREWTQVDKAQFENEIVPRNEPAVFRGFGRDWPVVAAGQAAPEILCDYLRGFGAQQPVNAFLAPPDAGGRYFYSDDLAGFNFQRISMPLGELLDRLMSHLQDESPPGIYAGAVPLTDGLAAVREQNPCALVDKDRQQLVSIWIGNRGRASAHWDLPRNIAVVAAGRRRFTLFPTEQLPNLYVGPLDVTIAGQPVSMVDFHAPDYRRYPRFRRALESASVVELGPGDGLYVPSLWFHHVESLDPLGAMINYWWREAEPWMITPKLTMMHALLSIRDLPEWERMAWRTLFDHYIFQINGDPMAHIPDAARGMFGKMNPERLQAIRIRLLESMGIRVRPD